MVIVMKNKIIDLSDIKENDLDKTSSFTDLMSRTEKRNRKLEKLKEIETQSDSNDDIEEMIDPAIDTCLFHCIDDNVSLGRNVI